FRRQSLFNHQDCADAGVDYGAYPRITPEDIEDQIIGEHYFTAENGVRGSIQMEECHYSIASGQGGRVRQAHSLLTFCVLTLRNGFIVTGTSACASPENYDPEIGQRIARENSINQIWPLLGYELKTKLYERSQLTSQPVTGDCGSNTTAPEPET